MEVTTIAGDNEEDITDIILRLCALASLGPHSLINCCESLMRTISNTFNNSNIMTVFMACSHNQTTTNPPLESTEPEVSLALSLPSVITLLCLYVITISVGIFGNGAVLFIIIKNKLYRIIIDLYVLSLTIGDLIFVLGCMPLAAVEVYVGEWIFGSAGCKILACLSYMPSAATSLTLCCLTIDRYQAIVNPLKQKLINSTLRVVITLVLVWLVAIISSIPFAYHFDTIQLPRDNGAIPRDNGAIRCIRNITKELTHHGYETLLWSRLIVLVFLPFCLMVLVHIKIVHKLWIMKPIGDGIRTTQDTRQRNKKRAIKMLILILLLYIICWGPTTIFDLIKEKSEVEINLNEDTLSVHYYLSWLAYSSSSIYPFLFTGLSRTVYNRLRLIQCTCTRPTCVCKVETIATDGSGRNETSPNKLQVPSHSTRV